jgi:hypothetical protein
MPRRLYLDTARLGLMSPRAQRAQQEFVRLAGIEGGSLYFDGFLRRGFEAWPSRVRKGYSGLCHWHGIGELKQALRTLAGMPPDRKVLLASRACQLMRLAARLLCLTCRRVLVSDLTWPGYARILKQEARRTAAELVELELRSPVLRDQVSSAEIAALTAARYRSEGCDGFFVPAVSHDGIRFPLSRTLLAIGRRKPPHLVVLNGAQAFCHTPSPLELVSCDFYLTGAHKWLGAHHPMGLAFCPRRRTQEAIGSLCDEMLQHYKLDDPLLRFLTELEHDSPEIFSETVNLNPLFACRAAVEDQLKAERSIRGTLLKRQANAQLAARLAAEVGWQPLIPEDSLRSAILLLKAKDRGLREAPPELTKRSFLTQGVAVSSLPGGTVRLSMPSAPWEPAEVCILRDVLRHSAGLLPNASAASLAGKPHAA